MSDDTTLKRTVLEDIQHKVNTLLQADTVSEENKRRLIEEALRVLETHKVKGVLQ